jgi:Uma2 family endonuclease
MATATTPQTWTIPGTDIVLDEEAMESRRLRGVDKYDEVWDGVLHVAPHLHNRQQEIVGHLIGIIGRLIGWRNLGHVYAGVNLSDRENDWLNNYRIPDLAVFLNGTKAKNCGTHWMGGPDFAVEIRSPGDETLQKIPFYEKVGTRELLVIDREPWSLVLYRLSENGLVPAGRSDLDSPEVIRSEVVPLAFRLVAGAEDGDHPAIEVEYPEADGQIRRLRI